MSDDVGAHTVSDRVRRVSLETLDDVTCEAMAVFCWDDVRPLGGVASFIDQRMEGMLSKTVASEFFAARPFEVMQWSCEGRVGNRRLFVFGLGASSDYSSRCVIDTVKRASDVMRRAGVLHLVFAVPACRNRPELEQRFVEVADAELHGAVETYLTEIHHEPAALA